MSEPIRHYDFAKGEFRDVSQADWSNLYRSFGLLSVAIKEAGDLSRRIALGEVEPMGQQEFYLRLALEEREKTTAQLIQMGHKFSEPIAKEITDAIREAIAKVTGDRPQH